MVSRRAFLTAAAPAALAPIAMTLSGCSQSFKDHVAAFAGAAYRDINVVAAYLDQLVRQVIAKAMTAADAAAAFVAAGADYIVPGLRLFVSIVKLAGQAAAVSPALASDKAFQGVLAQAQTLSGNPAVQSAVTSGTVPTDPLTLLTGVVDLAAQILTATKGDVTPLSSVKAV